MDVFELHAAYEMGDFVEGSEGGGPVGDRESGVVARDQGSGNDEQEYPAGEEDREAVMRAVVRCGQGLQNLLSLLSLMGTTERAPFPSFFRPCGAESLYFPYPKAYAVGCILAPLRGLSWEPTFSWPAGRRRHLSLF